MQSKINKDILFNIIQLILAVVTGALTPIFLLNDKQLPIIYYILMSLLIIITLSFSFFRALKRTPTTLAISILGYPNSGKTVYLTILFNELLTGQNQYHGSFRTYGTETIERITSDFKLLKSGCWLPPTPAEGVFYYRATASLSKLKKYKLEIADYAGEKFKNDLNENDNYFHKTDFFKFVMASDAVILAIDIDRFLLEKSEYITTSENSFIAALTLMQEQKYIGFDTKIKFPVAIVFMKSDLLSAKISQEGVLRQFDRLMNFCNKTCVHFKPFFVSSIGKIEFKEGTTNYLNPYGVIEPIVWLMRQAK